jgi:phosphate-selective porin O and P family protein
VGGTTKGGATESDGWYAMVGVPVPQCKDLKVYARWDCYRDDATRWNSLVTNWGLALNYYLGKQYVLQLNYTHTVDRNLAVRGGHYNTLDLQVSARF